MEMAYGTEQLREDIGNLLSILNSADYPETCGTLEDMLNDDFSMYDDECDIAGTLAECDGGVPMNPLVFGFLEELYETAVAQGNADAMNDLGALYYDGKGCGQNFAKAVYYYEMAAKNGSRQAQENLGYCYYYGRNMPVDYEKAFHYFALGAFDGHLISLYKIGDMYLNGYYVEKNEKEAFRIYEHCMHLMTEEAAEHVAGPVYLRLGSALLYGRGTEPDAKKALFCYQNAESYLYDMVRNGELMYKRSLQAAVEGQAKARAKLAEQLPGGQWLNGKKE